MTIMYGNQHVDERYSRLIEPNLFTDTPLIPGVTYSDKYTIGPAGGIYVHKLNNSTGRRTKPGNDFPEATDSGDTLIPIALNNCFQANEKIYNVAAAAVGIALANERMSNAVHVVRNIRGQSALACLAKEGTASSETSALTTSNVKKAILAERTALSSIGVKGDVVQCSPTFYSLILEAAGDKFIPNTNERMNSTGKVGTWLGFTFVENTDMAAGKALAYCNSAGDEVELAAEDLAKIDFIMYNHEFFSIIDNINMARIIDSEKFNGSLAQVEQNTGFKVTTAGCVRVRSHA